MRASEEHNKLLIEFKALRYSYDKLLAKHEELSVEHENTLRSTSSINIQKDKIEEQLIKIKRKTNITRR